MTQVYRPNHLLFEVAFIASTSDGPLKAIGTEVQKLGARMVSSTYIEDTDGRGHWGVFLDTRDRSLTSDMLRRALEKLGILEGLRVAGGSELIVESLYFPIVLSTGRRTMLFAQESFQRMHASLQETFGSGGAVISYTEGLATGSRDAGEARSIIKGDLQKFSAELLKNYAAIGVGICELVRATLDPPEFVVRIHRNIECEGRQSATPASHWVRGHLCGGVATALDTPMTCVETKCLATGSPYCEFELKRSEG